MARVVPASEFDTFLAGLPTVPVGCFVDTNLLFAADYEVHRLFEEAIGLGETITAHKIPIFSNATIRSELLELKRRVLSLRRQMNDHRELLQRLIRGDHPVVAATSHIYYRNILDHLNRIEDDLDVCRDTIDHAREVYVALMDARANQVMKILTVVFTISLPFTILTGWYGMNFDRLPFTQEPWAPWALTGVMLAIAGGTLYWLRKNRWF